MMTNKCKTCYWYDKCKPNFTAGCGCYDPLYEVPMKIEEYEKELDTRVAAYKEVIDDFN